MGWRWGWRRATAVAGATSVVLGFAGPIILAGILSNDAGPGLAAVVGLMLLVPLGFVLMWESLVTVPEDGFPYPWRRRVQGAAAALAAFGVVLLITRLAGAVLPNKWWIGLAVVGFASWIAHEVFRRLRPSHPAVTGTLGDV